MKSVLGKDDLEDSLLKFDTFEECRKRADQSMQQYIDAFDSAYTKVAKKGLKLPNECLGYKLMKNSGITGDERTIILTGLNYEKRDDMYKDAKKSLLKFKGQSSAAVIGKVGAESSSACASTPSITIKTEPTFITQQSDHEVLQATGFRRFPPRARAGRYPRGNGRYQSNGRYYQRPDFNSRNQKPDTEQRLCHRCGSWMHLVKDCLEKPDEGNRNGNDRRKVYMAEEVCIFTDSDGLQTFVSEARRSAVLDSACSSTVCGRQWLDDYLASLSPQDAKLVTRQEDNKMFKFGSDNLVQSNETCIIPANIAGNKIFIKTSIVNTSIPLLLSKPSMKKMGVVLDLVNDCAEVFGKTINLDVTSSGHYCVMIDSNVVVHNY